MGLAEEESSWYSREETHRLRSHGLFDTGKPDSGSKHFKGSLRRFITIKVRRGNKGVRIPPSKSMTKTL